jgi:curli biogenesis system outer membrane secretion channel CsgG
MRRLLIFTVLLATLLPVYAQTPAPAAPTPATAAAQTSPSSGATQGRKKRVAILDFDYGTVATNSAALFGTNIDVGKGITDLLVKYLVKDGTYSVIERKALDKVLAEQNFSNSDRANPMSAAKLGKLLGVDAIIVGSITQFGGETKNANVGGVGGGLGKIGFGGFGQKKTKAICAIDARMVDIDTAEILGVADGKGESQRQSTSLLGGGGGWTGFGAGNVDFGSSNFQETIIGEAVNKATEQLSSGLIANNTKLQARVVTVEGLVAAVEGGDIVLNVGSKSGLRPGQQLAVQRVTKEIKDPATGKVIRRLSTQIGTIEVTDVDEGSAVAKSVSGTGYKIGDMVKTTTQ